MEQFVRIETGHGFLFCRNNFSYIREPSNPNIFRCSKRVTEKCSAVIEIIEGDLIERNAGNEGIFGHNHVDTPFLVEGHNMTNLMLHEARTTWTSLHDIFRNISLTDPLVASHLIYDNIRVRMQNERTKEIPPAPQNLRELGQLLERMPRYRNIYMSTVYSGNSAAILFSKDELLAALEESDNLSADGTFKTHGAVYCLMDARSTELYSAILRAIKDRLPNLRVTTFTSDFELALINAIRENFVNVRVVGCWFHYVKAITTKWIEYGLENFDGTILDMCVNIPLLPQHMFTEARVAITTKAAEYQHEIIDRFVQYMITNWLNNPRLTSLYGVPNRTNNAIESFNKRATARLGGRKPHIWAMLDKLKVLMADELLDYERSNRGLPVRRPQSMETKRRNSVIAARQNDLISGRLTVPLFLQSLVGVLRPVKLQAFRIAPFRTGNNEEASEFMDEPDRINNNVLNINPLIVRRQHTTSNRREPYNRAVSFRNRNANRNL